MSCEPITDLVTDRRREVLAIVVLANFGLAFAFAAAIDVETMVRAGVFLVAFVTACGIEYAAACRWFPSRVRSLAYWIG